MPRKDARYFSRVAITLQISGHLDDSVAFFEHAALYDCSDAARVAALYLSSRALERGDDTAREKWAGRLEFIQKRLDGSDRSSESEESCGGANVTRGSDAGDFGQQHMRDADVQSDNESVSRMTIVEDGWVIV